MHGAIVLLHGVASNRTRWSEFVATTSLRERWTLLAPDLRGNGEFVDRGRIGTDVWCADIAALLDRDGQADAIIAGHCLGANLALHFADRHPQRSKGLILIEPMPPAALTGALRRVHRFRPLLHLLIPAVRMANALGIRRKELASLDLAQLDRETRAALARGPQGEEQLEQYASPLLDLRTTGTAAYLQQLLAAIQELPAPEAIRVPVLTLLAQHSSFTDLARTRGYVDRLRDGETILLPARHWIPTEQPEAMRRAIEDWIECHFPPH